jgi:hypothetical protein
VPVIVAIAVYFCIADGVLIGQCLYYKARNARLEALRRRRRSSTETPDPSTPLLGRRFSDTLPEAVARRRASVSSQRRGIDGGARQADDTLAKIVEENEAGQQAWVKNLSSVLAICVIGMAGWTIAWQSGVWKPAPREVNGGVDMAAGAQVVGYFSALCYLGYAPDVGYVEGGELTVDVGRVSRRSTKTTATSRARVFAFPLAGASRTR